MNDPTPLTDDDYKKLCESLHSLRDLRLKTQRAEKAGVDVASILEAIDYEESRLIPIKATYFPDRP